MDFANRGGFRHNDALRITLPGISPSIEKEPHLLSYQVS